MKNPGQDQQAHLGPTDPIHDAPAATATGSARIVDPPPLVLAVACRDLASARDPASCRDPTNQRMGRSSRPHAARGRAPSAGSAPPLARVGARREARAA